MKRSVFFLSDRTGITAETLAHSLLTQFEGVAFETISCPYLDSIEKADHVVARINQAAATDGYKPLLFSTFINTEIRGRVARSQGLLIDFFDAFISPLETELGIRSSHAAGRSHGVGAYASYAARIDAINFALANDDGTSTRAYPAADIVLIGVSRSGKTPTCLYLALQYGILAANYPLTEDDFEPLRLPAGLHAHRDKLFGLNINADRLYQLRCERRPNSRYATLGQCEREVELVESLYRRERIAFLNSSAVSIEEIATSILDRMGLERRLYG